MRSRRNGTRNTISPTTFALALISIALNSSCASFAVASLPRLELQTLELARDRPAAYYSWRECVKKNLFGQCRDWAQKRKYYDLTDQKTREQLDDIGFILKVQDKPLP